MRGTSVTVLLAALAIGISLLIPGCPVGYVARQSASYLRVLAARQSVDAAVASGRVPEEWRAKLEVLQDAKRFGTTILQLPAEHLYETISLAQSGPTWVVTACAKDSLTPVTWWFPVVGRVSYKGFARREHAEQQARRLGDVDLLLYPAAAFSTLGWFRDPIRPSMLDGSDTRIANTVLHEAAHGVLYWQGQTDFNESFATFVGDAGALQYLEDRLGEDCSPCIAASHARTVSPRFSGFIQDVVERLETLYSEPISREEKILQREEVFSWAKTRYQEIPWAGDTYDYFIQRKLDNAVILSYRRYDSGQDIFHELLAYFDGDLPATIDFIRSLPWSPSDSPPLAYLRETLETLQQGKGPDL